MSKSDSNMTLPKVKRDSEEEKLNYISQWCQAVIKWPDAILNYYIFYFFSQVSLLYAEFLLLEIVEGLDCKWILLRYGRSRKSVLVFCGAHLWDHLIHILLAHDTHVRIMNTIVAVQIGIK